ncbi:MAG: 1-deoxy-D-xylulose-5-phosphate reductoisomerase [Paludibacteraceae bacterium]|nr:1-deoxy-D-xylulose-5-phosphate reductoisomerase [Paludibacteraceae bacterium]MBP8627837.1 1-deoxy-D-xylulose-5-phosphate reductoisomerase [Paludibacteraceae bacterium]MBP9970966.1 1-deoxy-D-xylulose-5-phosphate reductoisomerase [Paludibacteraceae bacterium]
MNKKQIAILGSTGSIGTQALEVIAAHPDKFEVYAITANNSVELLIEQAVRFQPEMVIIANEQHYAYIKKALENYPIKVYAGVKAICEMVELPSVDVVLTAMVGYAGLLPTIHAVKAGKRIALANKETLVVAGEIICDLAQQYRSAIIPVDSEHSAIFQCLIGEQNASVEKIILTASGGPFRQKTYDELRQVTTRDALKHPNWEMGAKITIDSASLMNKGFEVIEAKWLFGLKPSQIEVLIHPQSIIHSMVQFVDGSVKAQIGLPDMKLPIQYAFAFPQRIENNYPRLDFTQYARFDFQQPDTSKFRNLAFAYDAMEKGGTMPCVLNAANEVVVAAFLEEKIGFLHMSDIIEKTMQTASWIAKPTYEDYVLADKQARELTLAQF